MATVNRGMLLRRAKAGKLEARCLYSLTDDHAHDAATNHGKMKDFLPVRINQSRNDWTPGFVNMYESDFQTGSGGAWKDRDGTIHLSVHSNLCYEVRIVA